MKTTSLIAIILTLLMLLLVLGAAFGFLYQNWQNLLTGSRGDMAVLEQEKLAAEQDFLIADATRSAAESALATEQANSAALGSESVAVQQEGTRLASELETANGSLGQLQQEKQALQAQPPTVMLVDPDDGDTYTQGDIIRITLSAADSLGLREIVVTINDIPFRSYSSNGETHVSDKLDWQPADAGIYTLAVTAENVNGVVSEPVTATVTVDPRPTPTPTPAPTATPVESG